MAPRHFTLADLNSGFVVAINLHAKPGQGDALADVLQQLMGPSCAEPGMNAFIPYRSPTDRDAFFIFTNSTAMKQPGPSIRRPSISSA